MKKAMAKKKPARKKKRWEVVCDLVDCWIDDEITKDELVEKLMKLTGKPIIEVSEMQYYVSEYENNLFLCCRAKCIDGTRDNWCDVEDLTDFTVGEYNQLVEKLHEHYPDYQIDYLEGRFV